MKSIEQQGKTVDDAIQKALEHLQVSREQVSVEILDEGSRGLFGFMGSKPAKVRVMVNTESTYNAIKEELQAVQKHEQSYQETSRATATQEERTRPQEQSQKEQQLEKKQQVQSTLPQYDEENFQKIISTAKEALQVILKQLQIEYSVEVKQREDQILLNIHCDNENFLIGRRGTTLDAVQYLVNRIANKNAQGQNSSRAGYLELSGEPQAASATSGAALVASRENDR